MPMSDTTTTETEILCRQAYVQGVEMGEMYHAVPAETILHDPDVLYETMLESGAEPSYMLPAERRAWVEGFGVGRRLAAHAAVFG